MTSNLDHAQIAIDLIGGDPALTRLKAKGIESREGGVAFLVPILGGLVRVEVIRNQDLWDIELGLDLIENVPRSIREVPGENLGLIVSHLFRL